MTNDKKPERKPLLKNEIVPIDDKYVVEPFEPEEKSRGGIVLPDTAREKPQRGKVLAAGPGALKDGQRVKPSAAVGDVVLFGRWAGHNIEADDCKDLKILADHDLLAKVTE